MQVSIKAMRKLVISKLKSSFPRMKLSLCMVVLLLCFSAGETSKNHVQGVQSTDKQLIHTGAVVCPSAVTWDQLRNLSKSQSKEDSVLWHEFFRGLCQGKYIELGALDGIRFSNTHIFSKGLNWTGVLIEASPSNYKKLSRNRQEDELHHSAVCRSARMVHVIDKGAVGGIYEFMPKSFRTKWHPKVKETDLSAVKCQPLGDILRLHRYFDFFSLDVEGGELQVLQTIDFSKVQFGVIFLEADGHNPLKNEATKSYLQAQGYRHLFTKQRSAWFINNDFHSIYEHVLYLDEGLIL